MVTYCTATEVSAFLQTTTFDANTTPTNTEVESLILGNETVIDKYTQHAWREVTITEEYIDPKVVEPSLGLRYDLQHRKIRDLQTGTDKIEIYTGTQFLDYVANKTEGFREDYFLDQTNGVVYIKDRFTIFPKGSRFTYRYGESSVPADIKKACILLTAADVISGQDNVTTFTDDGPSNRLNHNSRLDYYREKAYEILDNYKEIKTL